MDDRTEQLVDDVERAGRIRDDVSVVTNVRSLWNYEERDEDADVELWIGPYANIKDILIRVRAMDSWTVKYFDTAEPSSDHDPMALIYEPGSAGRLFH